MIGLAYNQVFTELVEKYKFIMKDKESGVQPRMKIIGAMLWVDWYNSHMPS